MWIKVYRTFTEPAASTETLWTLISVMAQHRGRVRVTVELLGDDIEERVMDMKTGQPKILRWEYAKFTRQTMIKSWSDLFQPTNSDYDRDGIFF